ASSVASRSVSSPRTLTKTFAVRRSGLVSTPVTVTNPRRGSESSEIVAATTSRTASSTRRIRAPAIAISLEGLLDLFGLEELDHVALFDVRVTLEHDAALLTLVDFGDVVFEAS